MKEKDVLLDSIFGFFVGGFLGWLVGLLLVLASYENTENDRLRAENADLRAALAAQK